MKQYRTMVLLIFFILICLTSCGSKAISEKDTEVSNTEKSIVSESSLAENSATENFSQKEKIAPVVITVETVKYERPDLTYIYGGETYVLPVEKDAFKDDLADNGKDILKSIQVINNKLGEKISAKLTLSYDQTKIIKCDVLSQNGMVFSDGMLNTLADDSIDPDTVDFAYTFTRKEGSLCELSNINRTLEADLNDLPDYLKLDYPNEFYDVEFTGYLFNDGKFILNEFYLPEKDENGKRKTMQRYSLHHENLTGFFGTVQKLDDARAEILLNDGKTICNVPTYYNDGEISEGEQIMFVLDCEPDLYGSGENNTYNYAVIYTDISKYDIENAAYAKKDPHSVYNFIVTQKDDVK